MTEQKEIIKVVEIVNDWTIVINKGETSGIACGQKYLIYRISNEEIKDIETGESLGHLEIVKGTGIVKHVQEKMATIESNSYESIKRTIKRPNYSTIPFNPFFKNSLTEEVIEETKEQTPFVNVEKGDFVKRIS